MIIKDSFCILYIHNKEYNGYLDKSREFYKVYLFPEYKYALYIPFKYKDNKPIKCIYG